MHAVVVRVKINDEEGGRQSLREEVVPRVKQAPGFVAGYWTRSDSDNSGLSMIVFDSQEGANTAKQMIESQGPPSDAVTLEGVEVREVVEHA